MDQARSSVDINNDSALFDEIKHTQAGMPHLLQYLWNRYVLHLQEEISKRQEAKQPTVTIQEALKRAPAISFVTWASDFLKETRVVENFFVDANHGIRLANMDAMVICPGTTIQGTMQESGAIAITEGKSQADNEGVFNPHQALSI